MTYFKVSDEGIDMQAAIFSRDGAAGIARLQTAVYAMVGGGMLGAFAMRCPVKFYIDDRVGRLPYSRAAIRQAVRILVRAAEQAGMNPADLEYPNMPNLGVF